MGAVTENLKNSGGGVNRTYWWIGCWGEKTEINNEDLLLCLAKCDNLRIQETNWIENEESYFSISAWSTCWSSSEGLRYGVTFISVELNGEMKSGDGNPRVIEGELTWRLLMRHPIGQMVLVFINSLSSMLLTLLLLIKLGTWLLDLTIARMSLCTQNVLVLCVLIAPYLMCVLSSPCQTLQVHIQTRWWRAISLFCLANMCPSASFYMEKSLALKRN